MIYKRTATLFAGTIALSVMLGGCAAGEVDTDSSESTALVEEFFADLEAGRATDAAALTAIDFDKELIDDEFYRASVALPTKARIVTSSGSQAGASVTIEFALEGVTTPVSLEVHTTREGDELRISDLGTTDTIGAGRSVPGTLTINGRREYQVAELTRVTMLPGAYSVEFTDPTGLLEGLGRDSSFTAYVPAVRTPDGETVAEGFAFAPTFRPDVEPGLKEALEQLQAACEKDGFTGPSCPTEFTLGPRKDSLPEWFRQPGPEIRLIDGSYEVTARYAVVFWNGDVSTKFDATYTGVISRDASGKIALTRP